MSTEPREPRPEPDDAGEPDGTGTPRFVWDYDVNGRVTMTYYSFPIEGKYSLFTFDHDDQKGVFVLTMPDGTTERFRDNPTRHLTVEPDPETGEMRPVTKHGRPCYVYLCREQRET
jgi:hypothetical protein